MQRLFRTGLCAFVAKNTLRSVFPLAGFFIGLHIHGADPQALATVNAFILITVDTQEREVAHRLEEHCDGAQIFAERTVILEYKGKRNACNVVKHISGEEQPKHDLLQICNLHQKQSGHQRKRQSKHHIAQKPKFFLSGLLRLLVGQKVQHHGCPAGISAPATPEQQRTEDLRHGVVDGRRFKNTEEQIK